MKVTKEDARRVCELFRDEEGDLCVKRRAVLDKIRINYECSEDEADAALTLLVRAKAIEMVYGNNEIYICDPI